MTRYLCDFPPNFTLCGGSGKWYSMARGFSLEPEHVISQARCTQTLYRTRYDIHSLASIAPFIAFLERRPCARAVRLLSKFLFVSSLLASDSFRSNFKPNLCLHTLTAPAAENIRAGGPAADYHSRETEREESSLRPRLLNSSIIINTETHWDRKQSIL